jgi:predicted Zn finger-like uncharacterized protein
VRDFRSRTNPAVGAGSSIPHTAPASCPSCRSAAIVTKMKEPDADTYWRCTSCGEVWNDTRRQRAPRRGMFE